MSGEHGNIYLTGGKKNFPVRQTDSQSKFLSLLKNPAAVEKPWRGFTLKNRFKKWRG